VLVETGTWNGGSALWYAHVFDIIGKGAVVSIDSEPKANLPQHPRIMYLAGDSPEVARELDLDPAWKVMASLDSDHSREHVARELDVFRDIVTPGQYLVVEDTNLNGHPVFEEHGPGPYEAVREFDDPRFTVDESLAKRHLFSMHTWLVKDDCISPPRADQGLPSSSGQRRDPRGDEVSAVTRPPADLRVQPRR
jgi:cephalosporin hydroxylase